MSKRHEELVKHAMKVVERWMGSEAARAPVPMEALALGICMGELKRLRGLRNPGSENPDFSSKTPHKTRRN